MHFHMKIPVWLLCSAKQKKERAAHGGQMCVLGEWVRAMKSSLVEWQGRIRLIMKLHSFQQEKNDRKTRERGRLFKSRTQTHYSGAEWTCGKISGLTQNNNEIVYAITLLIHAKLAQWIPNLKIINLSRRMSLPFYTGNTVSISLLLSSHSLFIIPLFSLGLIVRALSFIVSGNVTRGRPRHGVMTSDMSWSRRHTDPVNLWNAHSAISKHVHLSFTPPKHFFISFHVALVSFSYWLQKNNSNNKKKG